MRSVALAAALLGVLAWGCSRGVARVFSVRLVPGAADRSLELEGITAERVDDLARSALLESGFRLVKDPPGYRARLQIRSAAQAYSSAAGCEVVDVTVELALAREAGARTAELVGAGMATVRVDGHRAEAWSEAVAAAVRRASSGLALALAAEEKPDERLVADLRSDDPRRREQAVRVLGDRRSAAAVPALLDLLGDPDPEMAERAAGALSRIGDPRAVGPIIDFSLGLDGGRHVARYARIVGDIGGSEARGYLLTLESGHPDPEVRAAAREALADLDAREAEQARVAGKAPTKSSRPGSGSMAR